MKIESTIQQGFSFNGNVPIGTIIMWAGPLPGIDFDITSPPPTYVDPAEFGWLPCDGRTLLVQNYYPLYYVLGDIYSYVKAPSATTAKSTQETNEQVFKIPDLRGFFVRVGNGIPTIDTDPRNQVELPIQDKSSLEIKQVGSTQNFAIYEHTHDALPSEKTTPAGQGPTTTSISIPGNTETTNTYAPNSAAKPQWSSELENRPVNITLHYLIKAS